MAIFAQDGWGKADKINRGLQEGSITGVILSPRDEAPSSLAASVCQFRSVDSKTVMMFDPQFYASTVVNPRDGHLPEYPYYHGGLTRSDFSDPQAVQDYVRDTLDYQYMLDLDRVTTPTVFFEDFGNQWSQIGLMMAQASVNYHAKTKPSVPLLVSLVVSETALHSQAMLEDYLDALSLMQAQGVYLVVCRVNPQYQTAFEPTPLENLLYLVYALAEVNGFEVVCGYSDFVGMLLTAVGAKATAVGWSHNLRQFTMDRFLPKSGGRQPKPRYSSLPLLNSVTIDELDSISYVGHLSSVLSGTPYDSDFNSTENPSNIAWPPDISGLHHWAVLNRCAVSVQTGTIGQRLDACLGMLANAEALYSSLMGASVTFDVNSGSRHLGQWRQALGNFRARVGI